AAQPAAPARAAFTPDVSRIAVHGGGGPVVIFDRDRKGVVAQLEADLPAGAVMALSADGKLLLACLEPGEIAIWDVEKGKEVRRLEGHTAKALSVAISGDGKRILSGGLDHTVRLWDAATGKELAKLQHAKGIGSVAFSPDGKRAAIAAFDRVGV